MNEDQSQGTEQEEQVEEEGGRKVIAKPTDTQTQEQEESNKSKGEETEELFNLPDGRKVPAEELSKEWKENFYPEFTRRSQQLADFKRAEEGRKAEAEKSARSSVDESDILKGITPEVKEAIIKIMSPEMESLKKDLTLQSQQKEADATFDRQIEALEKEFPGSDGKPKFDRVEVLKEMQKEGNKNFDLKSLFRQVHEEEFMDIRIKEALKKQKGGTQTESTGKTSHKPDRKSPKTFAEAAKATQARFKNS